MTLEMLRERDSSSTAKILAAAALATSPNARSDDDSSPLESNRDVDRLLNEVLHQLKLDPADKSPAAAAQVSRYLSQALKETFKDRFDSALRRAGQSGRLPTSLYDVEVPPNASSVFYPLGVRFKNLEEAVRFPDDYQHLMTQLASAENKDVISLFMKRVDGVVGGAFWLLVQTHRGGTKQIIQAAWRVYPDLVNLDEAAEPLHVLRAFVDVYGMPFLLNGKEIRFLESELVPANIEPMVGLLNRDDVFNLLSWTNTDDPKIRQLGVGYCIDIRKYREMLKARGVQVHDKKIKPFTAQATP
jgi:hypothetical protein